MCFNPTHLFNKIHKFIEIYFKNMTPIYSPIIPRPTSRQILKVSCCNSPNFCSLYMQIPMLVSCYGHNAGWIIFLDVIGSSCFVEQALETLLQDYTV
jgi:hypothetical protein